MTATPPLERLALTVPEAAEVLGMSKTAAYTSIADGSWPCPAALFKVRSLTKVSLPILHRWLNGEISGDGVPVLSTAAASSPQSTSGLPAALSDKRRREGQAPWPERPS